MRSRTTTDRWLEGLLDLSPTDGRDDQETRWASWLPRPRFDSRRGGKNYDPARTGGVLVIDADALGRLRAENDEEPLRRAVRRSSHQEIAVGAVVIAAHVPDGAALDLHGGFADRP